jgi:hypothetical protein
MKHILLCTTICALLAGFITQAAKADSDSSTANSSPITIKLGAFVPTNSYLKQWFGSEWYRATGEYALTSSNSNGQAYLYAEFIGQETPHVYTQGYNVTETCTTSNGSVGVSLSTLSNPGRHKVLPYAVVSGGVAFDYLRWKVTTYNTSGVTSDSIATLAFKLGGGININNQFVIEGDYDDYGIVDNYRINGYGVSIGYHF